MNDSQECYKKLQRKRNRSNSNKNFKYNLDSTNFTDCSHFENKEKVTFSSKNVNTSNLDVKKKKHKTLKKLAQSSLVIRLMKLKMSKRENKFGSYAEDNIDYDIYVDFDKYDLDP